MAVGLLGRPSADGQERRSPHPRPPVHYPFGPRSEQYLGVWDIASWLPRAEPHGVRATKACSRQAPLPFCRGRKSPCGDSTDFIRPQHQHPTPGDQTAPEILTEVCAKHKGDSLTILLAWLKQHPPMLRLPPARRKKKISNVNFRTGHGRGPVWAGVFPEERIKELS